MKYFSVNEFNTFCFHDAWIINIYQLGTDLVAELAAMCVSTQNSQNHEETDMQIESAMVKFSDFSMISARIYGYTITYPDKSVEVVEDRAVPPGEFATLIGLLKEGWVKDSTLTDNLYGLNLFIGEKLNDLYDITFSASAFTVAWDEYSGPAWYMRK